MRISGVSQWTSERTTTPQTSRNPSIQPSIQPSMKIIPAEDRLSLLTDMYGEKRLKQMGLIACETCSSRLYVDGSDDPGVSFKTPEHISPEASFAMVNAHENEHVTNERADAHAEDREVVAQSVRIYMSVCPECGKHYSSGGLTTTVTADKKPYDDIGSIESGHLLDGKV